MDITVERIMFLLKENNVEQKDLAQHLGINRQTITDWKNGKTKSYQKCIEKIAEFFNVSVDYLLGRTDSSNGYYSISNSHTTITGTQANVINNASDSDGLLREFLQAFSELSFDDKVSVMQYVKDIKKVPSEYGNNK